MAKILYLVHSLPPEEHTGTPLFAYGYAQAMAARGHLVTVVYPSPTATSWTLTPERRPGEAFDRIVAPPTPYAGPFWSIEAASDGLGANPESAAAFLEVLTRVQPDLIHVVNNVNLPLDWPELAKANGIPVVRSVTCAEDLCGLIAPVSPRSGQRGYCSPPLTPEHCARCLAAVFADPDSELGTLAPWIGVGGNGGEDEHRALVAKLSRKRARAAEQYLQVFDRTVFATAAFRRYFEQTIPLDPARVRVIEMGVASAPPPDPSPDCPALLSDRLPVEEDRAGDGATRPVMFCLAATLDPAKGIDTVVEAFTDPRLRDRGDYRLCMLGAGNQNLVAALLDANPNVIMMGAYRPDDLPEFLTHMDVGLSTSGFETFHRVTREYLLAGLPVIGSHAFGIPDIVRPGKNGLLFDSKDATTLVEAVLSLLDDPEMLATLTEGAGSTAVRSPEEEATDLDALYQELLAGSDSAHEVAGPRQSFATRSRR
ncbi:MAG TPA: glycosyltransferase family 4 protein [Acidimicrobiales bacterium]|jgi:glycosyltransferase involved in cell wall biosynthesis|nr:glycosyltransferase family 4 protein [Acidimicrobiales bacterium]